MSTPWGSAFGGIARPVRAPGGGLASAIPAIAHAVDDLHQPSHRSHGVAPDGPGMTAGAGEPRARAKTRGCAKSA